MTSGVWWHHYIFFCNGAHIWNSLELEDLMISQFPQWQETLINSLVHMFVRGLVSNNKNYQNPRLGGCQTFTSLGACMAVHRPKTHPYLQTHSIVHMYPFISSHPKRLHFMEPLFSRILQKKKNKITLWLLFCKWKRKEKKIWKLFFCCLVRMICSKKSIKIMHLFSNWYEA